MLKKPTSVRVKDIIEGIVEELSYIVTEHLNKNMRTCINCCNFDEKQEMCLHWKTRPPAKVIALGCEKWEDIPF